MLFIFPILYACKQSAKETSDTGIVIQVSADSTGVELHNIPSFILNNFKTDSLAQHKWKSFFAVYEDPKDSELRDIQSPLKGTYTAKDSLIIFIPHAGFKKNQKYFAECYTKEILLKSQNLFESKKLMSSGGFIEYKFQF